MQQLPRWLAPNLITLTGTFGLILAYFVSAYFVPSFSGERMHIKAESCHASGCPPALLQQHVHSTL